MGADHRPRGEHLGPGDIMIARTRRRALRAARAFRETGQAPPGVDTPELFLSSRSGYFVDASGSDWQFALRPGAAAVSAAGLADAARGRSGGRVVKRLDADMLARRPTTRRGALLTMGGLAAAIGCPAFAQDDRSPVRLLCGLAAGTGNDLTARIVADRMKEVLGRPINVENKPGAAQRLTLNELRRAPPDGRTLALATTGPFAIYPHIYTKLDYDPFRDFTPLCAVASFDVGIASGSKTQAKTVAELVDAARAIRTTRSSVRPATARCRTSSASRWR